jgi:hypothetical protein
VFSRRGHDWTDRVASDRARTDERFVITLSVGSRQRCNEADGCNDRFHFHNAIRPGGGANHK